MNDTKQNLGLSIVNHLVAEGRKNKKAAVITTLKLAEMTGYPVDQVYSRLWWLENKTKAVVSVGGKAVAPDPQEEGMSARIRRGTLIRANPDDVLRLARYLRLKVGQSWSRKHVAALVYWRITRNQINRH